MRFLFCGQVSETHLRGDTLDGSLSLSSLEHFDGSDLALFTSDRQQATTSGFSRPSKRSFTLLLSQVKMTLFSPRQPHLLLLHLLLLILPAATAPDAACDNSGSLFRPGRENFVLDVEDAVSEGAALLATAHVQDADACQRACCAEARCSLALLEPPHLPRADAGNVTCALFSCVHRNRFVCRFVTKAGYRSFIRESVFQKHLRGPQGGEGKSRDGQGTHGKFGGSTASLIQRVCLCLCVLFYFVFASPAHRHRRSRRRRAARRDGDSGRH